MGRSTGTSLEQEWWLMTSLLWCAPPCWRAAALFSTNWATLQTLCPVHVGSGSKQNIRSETYFSSAVLIKDWPQASIGSTALHTSTHFPNNAVEMLAHFYPPLSGYIWIYANRDCMMWRTPDKGHLNLLKFVPSSSCVVRSTWFNWERLLITYVIPTMHLWKLILGDTM